jgi:hypothetical protein
VQRHRGPEEGSVISVGGGHGDSVDMFALLTYLLLAGGTARLAHHVVSSTDAPTRETATVLWSWQALTLAVAVLPSLPMLDELLFSCALVLAVGDPVHVDAAVRTRLLPYLADRVSSVVASSPVVDDAVVDDAVVDDAVDDAQSDATTEDPM